MGNYWSASVEIQVGLSAWPVTRREVFLKEQIFMNRLESSLGDNKQKMMFLKENQFNEDVAGKKWDRIKVICRQPFKINNECFGLAMFVLHGLEEENIKKTVQTPQTSHDSLKENGLDSFKNKAKAMCPSPKSPYVNSVLKNLENIRKVGDAEEEVRKPSSSSFSSSSMSRTANLVMQGQKSSGVKMSFETEAKLFLKSCEFDKRPFAEIETITFRHVKELWAEKKKTNLSKEEKDTLKKMSGTYLNHIVSKTTKRPREKSDEEIQTKKRKISKHVEDMRKESIDDLYDDAGGGGGLRNKIATSDLRTKHDIEDEDDDEEIKKMRKKFNIDKSKFSTPKPASSVKKQNDLVDNDLPTFDLTCSPEISPVKKIDEASKLNHVSPVKEKIKEVKSISPPKKQLSKVTPNYNRKLLLSVPHEDLIKAGVLVQVNNYKKDKQLPLKGGLELSTKKGETVTFFKVGPDVHLEYQGRFYLPDIQHQHLERVFKKFSPSQVHSSVYPDNIDSLLKSTSRTQISEAKDKMNSEDTSDKNDQNHDSSPTSSYSSESQTKPDSSDKEKNHPSEGSCPLCSKMFRLDELESHAAACQGPGSDDNSDSG